MEQKLHPEYDGMPLAVCGDPKARHGIVLAKNQLAKQAGVKTAETIWEAKQKCPELVLVEPHFDEYVKYSKQVFEIYTSFTDRVESFGIDECWLDVTGCERLFGDGKAIADTLRKTVKEKTGLTISVGVSFTKTLAKLGSDLKKPDATTVLDEKHYMQIIGNMPPSEMIMVGKHTSEKLEKLNIRTIKDLANADRNALRYQFGIIADTLVNAAQGIETEEVKNTMTCASPRACQKARPLRETSRARTRQKSSYTPLPKWWLCNFAATDLWQTACTLQSKIPRSIGRQSKCRCHLRAQTRAILPKQRSIFFAKYTISASRYEQSRWAQSGCRKGPKCNSAFLTTTTAEKKNLTTRLTRSEKIRIQSRATRFAPSKRLDGQSPRRRRFQAVSSIEVNLTSKPTTRKKSDDKTT